MTYVPIKVAAQYSHRFSTILPDNKAGAKEWAGFIDALNVKPINNMFKQTLPPIAISLKPQSPSIL
jgi:hypothetical protein